MKEAEAKRIAALSALETAVLSQPELPSTPAGSSQLLRCSPCASPSEELRSALKKISRFNQRCKPEEAETALVQLMNQGSHSSLPPSATARHMEDWLMSSGGAEFATAVLSSFMNRPAVRPLLERVQQLQDADAKAMEAMIVHANEFLNMLKTNGNNYTEDENAIRVLLAALIPSGDISQMVSVFGRLLGMSRHRIMQGNKTEPKISPDKCAGWVRTVRKVYSNKIDLAYASDFLHEACRIDTNSQRKKRHYIGPRQYEEHWRHIMYDSLRGYHALMLESQGYAEWRRLHPKQTIEYGQFCKAKCFCMVECDFTECADPVKTIFTVLLAVVNKLAGLFVKARTFGRKPPATLTSIHKATGSLHYFLKATLCPKVRCASLELGANEVRFYKQECGYHSCSECGWDEEKKCWPLLPVLSDPMFWSTTETIEYQAYHPMPRG
jgi:hypothetical protein